MVMEADMYRGAYEGEERELLNKLYRRDEAAIEARLAEHNSVGSEDIKVLELWKEATRLSLEIYRSVNKTSLEKLKREAGHEGHFKSYVFPAILCTVGLIGGYLLGKFL